MWANIDTQPLWAFRTVGGALMGVSVFAFWAIGNGSRIEYRGALNSLSEIQAKLAAVRKNMGLRLTAVNDGLQARTQQALIPQLDAIRDLLGNFATADAAKQLRDTISNQIRPIMIAISKEIPEPFEIKDMSRLKSLAPKMASRFTLKNKIEVTYSSLIEILGLAIWLAIFESPNGLLDILALFAIFFTVMSIFKLMVPKDLRFSRNSAILTTSIFALAASSANVIYLYYLNYSPPQFWMLTGFAYICGVMGTLLVMQLGEVRELRLQVENQIRADLQAVAKENALFAQKVWVFRKRWLLVLHGNVQSALTAALTRLQNTAKVDSVVVELVKQDLRRAELAVNSNLTDEVDLQKGLGEVTEVWSGICDVSVTISERAKRALSRNTDTGFCVNELVKEAVSNAVRHGEATKVEVEIDRLSDDLLHVVVTNDGAQPKSQNVEPGIGSEMLDEICLDWKLTSDEKSVVLKANLPIKL
jgi:hypothetical protein